MKLIRLVGIAVWLAAALCAQAALAASPSAAVHEVMSHDGLQVVKVKGIELAYARPGASLAAYNRVMLEPVEVAFSKDWNPNRTGSSFKLSAEERDEIRKGVAQLVYDEFKRALQDKSSYQVVDAVGPDVLRVKVNIINLYVNAPDTLTAGRTRTYTASAGEMTLVAEMFDSESGQVLARAVDRRDARRAGNLSFANSVTNSSEARIIASSWARILRDAMDKAHGIGKR
jgi:Protein of unknown function (DUF3313)